MRRPAINRARLAMIGVRVGAFDIKVSYEPECQRVPVEVEQVRIFRVVFENASINNENFEEVFNPDASPQL